MKTITVRNPELRLKEIMFFQRVDWIRTCHDAGYYSVTGDVPDYVEVAEVGPHPFTIRVDDAAGRAQLATRRAMTAAKALRRKLAAFSIAARTYNDDDH